MYNSCNLIIKNTPYVHFASTSVVKLLLPSPREHKVKFSYNAEWQQEYKYSRHTINKISTVNIYLINKNNLTINFTLLNMAPESFPWITSCFPSAQADEKFSGSYQAHSILYTLFLIIVIKNSLTTSLYSFYDRMHMLFCNQMSQSHYIM